MGVDQQGQDPTVAAARAVRNPIAHNALPGVWEVAVTPSRPETPTHVMRGSDMTGWVLPDAIPLSTSLRSGTYINFRNCSCSFPGTSAVSRTAGSPAAMVRKTIAVESGGMVVQGRAIPEINDKNDEMLIAVAAVTVIVDNEDT